MRKGYRDSGLLFNEDEVFYGVSLGWDFTAEHEWGIKGITRIFNIKSEKLGYKGRKVNNKDKVHLKFDENLGILISKREYRPEREGELTAEELLPRDLKHFNSDNDVETAWAEYGFCVVSNKKENFKYLQELYDAFQKKDIVIAYFSPHKGNVFGNSALSLLIIPKLSKEDKDAMMTVDKKANNLVKYEKKIGVTKLKEKAQKNYTYKGENYFCACSPKWIDYEDEKNRELLQKKHGTKFDIRYWVNYSDDDENYGWYNAEDIIKWLSTPGLKLTEISKGGSKRYEDK